jgi:hypothetical protein
MGPFSLERMVRAVERVKERLKRAAAALEAANVPYAVIGGNAVASWVARVDPAGVRNTADVDLLLHRDDLDAAGEALKGAGFVPYELLGIPMFLDGVQGGPRDALHVILAGEKVRPDDLIASPEVTESVFAENAYRVINLDALVRMKLTSFRDKDRTHLRDFIDVGLIDESWLQSVPAVLAPRLQQLFDTPGG